MIQLVKDFLGLKAMLAEQEAAIAETKSQLSAIERRLIDEFTDNGVQNLNAGGQCVYLNAKVVVSPKGGVENRKVVSEALIACGLGDFVQPTWNHQTVEAYVRRQLESEQELPEKLRDVLDIREIYSIRSRKA